MLRDELKASLVKIALSKEDLEQLSPEARAALAGVLIGSAGGLAGAAGSTAARAYGKAVQNTKRDIAISDDILRSWRRASGLKAGVGAALLGTAGASAAIGLPPLVGAGAAIAGGASAIKNTMNMSRANKALAINAGRKPHAETIKRILLKLLA